MGAVINAVGVFMTTVNGHSCSANVALVTSSSNYTFSSLLKCSVFSRNVPLGGSSPDLVTAFLTNTYNN
jgi:hypothetical protein